jgi:hypothetical protein
MLAVKRLLIFSVLFLTFLAAGRALAQAGAPPPTVGNLSVSNITQTSARLSASVTTNGASTQVFFEYARPTDPRYTQAGNVQVQGSATPSTANFSLSGLTCGTDYVFRAIAVNQFGQDGPHTPKPFTTGTCISVTLASSGSAQVGGLLTLTANATGGSGALTYEFELDGDNVYDRSGSASSVQVKYPAAYDGNVTVRVTDSTGSSAIAQRHITIGAPHLTVTSVGTPNQICGDGDGAFDPGEKWSLSFTIKNDGTVAENGGYALFFPTDQVSGGITTAETHLLMDNPAAAIGNLAPGALLPVTLTFSFADDAACGATYRLSFAGGADAVSSSAGVATPITSFTLPASCQITTGCPKSKAITPPRQGLYYNASRSGNGLSNFLIPGANGRQTYFGAWFTANDDHTPTWYIVQGDLLGAAVKAPILKFTRELGSPTFSAKSAEAGRATVAMIDSSHMLMAWTLGARAGAEVMEYFTTGSAPNPNRTGAWYNPNESGWGEVIHQFDSGGVSNTFAVNYIYDASAQPRWVIGQETTANFAAGTSAKSFTVHCPGCPWLADWNSFPQASGTASAVFTDATTGRTTTDIVLPAPLTGTWQRSNLPLQLLTVPQ